MSFLNLFRSRVYRNEAAQRVRLYRARTTYEHARRLYEEAKARQDTRAMSQHKAALIIAQNGLLAAEMGRQ
jgi:hypothetical protein